MNEPMKTIRLSIRTAAFLLAAAVAVVSASCNQPQGKGEKTEEAKHAQSGIDKIKHDLHYSRAVEAAIWGMPLMNFDAMRQAYFRDAGAQYNDVIYFSQFANWKFQTTTPNNSTNYVMFFCNLKDSPVVVDIPVPEDAALFGSLISARNKPLADVGNTEGSKGTGGKYLLLPPGYKGNVPAGYTAVPSETYNIYSLLRVIPKSSSKKDVDNAIAYLHKLKIYPQSNPSKAIRYIDVYDKPFEGITQFDISYYTNLAKLVKEEPVQTHDLSMMGLFYTIGIGKDIEFKPDAGMKTIFEQAIQDVHAYLIDGYDHTGAFKWPGKQWRIIVSPELVKSRATGTFGLFPDRVLVDDLAFFFYGVFGSAVKSSPNLYIKTYRDAHDKFFNGSNTYKLTVPANVPTTQFWSVIAQDNQTSGFIRNAQSVGVNSFQNLKKNADGSVDVYFSLNPPKGYESNWVSTVAGQDFFLMFRIYGANPEVLKSTSPWTLNDVVKVE